jgi:gamma-glutamylcyclotransferase (GGCT)/AIG2-like uncharacterized protein YtfP
MLVTACRDDPFRARSSAYRRRRRASTLVSARQSRDLSDFREELPPMAAAGRVFVYGTLMPGEPRWPALAPYAVGWEPVTAPGWLWDTGRGYPALRFDGGHGGGGGGAVPGVLVTLDPDRLAEALDILDAIEDEGRLYRRVEVVTSGGPAYAYEWLGPTEGLDPLAAGWPPAP